MKRWVKQVNLVIILPLIIDHPALPSVLAYCFAPPLPHRQRILRVSWPFLYNIPMLSEAGAIKAQNVDTRGR